MKPTATLLDDGFRREPILVARRQFVLGLGVVAHAPLALLAQPPRKLWRIGLLHLGSKEFFVDNAFQKQFLQGMREQGYALDRDFIVEERFAAGEVGRLPDLAAALKVGINVLPLDAANPGEIERAIAAMPRERMQAFLALPDTIYSSHLEQIARLALKHHLPSSYVQNHYPEAGGLMSYGQDTTGYWRLCAKFIDKIFKGARPGDIPFEQPATFELVINMKTAQALGIKIPQTMLIRATKVIE